MNCPEVRPLASTNRSQVLQELRRVVPTDIVLESLEAIKPFECDALSMHRKTPLLVALPNSMEQVKAILQVCHRLEVPVVTRGAGTGLSGGALPHEQGVLLVLTRLNRILEIDPLNRTARLQPGVRNLAISEAVAEYGLYYAPDPSSQIACSIGGNVAENSGGVHCLKYGLTVHNVLEVRILTIEGEELVLGGATLDTPGYDLLALINGSEGMLGNSTGRAGRICQRRTGRGHRQRHHCGGNRSGRPGNDGPALGGSSRSVQFTGLSSPCRGSAAVRIGWR